MRTNDIENVGHDARHETFFEMLGNFSFADYFKAEAIAWAHELITEGYGIDHDLLWVTVYDQDEEAASAWVDLAGIAPERIVRRGKLDDDGELANYWHTHAAGPAGPCSEIFVDRGPRYGPDGGPDVDEERFMEIWNLVFIQDQVDGERRGRGAAARQERRHRFLARAGGDGPAGRRQRVRDRPVPPHARGSRAALRASATARIRTTTCPSRSWPSTAAPPRS